MTATAHPAAPALCRGRIVFADEAELLAWARDTGATVDRKLGGYPCDLCNGWHAERRRWLR